MYTEGNDSIGSPLVNELNNLADIFAAFQLEICFRESCRKKGNPVSKDRWHDINAIRINQIFVHKTADDFTSAHKPNISGVFSGNQI